ncbi:hypothetical protein AYO40_03690 [Planctomycetaceae bacterium SCGC AG-212-D15]|nr:hypothetical protein AYO40_03690 [Planctomycetaceae bacterium SCGC AG-212-D15]
MSTVKDFYHSVVPLQMRKRIWELLRHESVIELRKALHRPIASVRVAHGDLYVDVRDLGVGRPLFERSIYEPVETALLSRLLTPGMSFVDIGANIGYYTTLAGRAVGKAGWVLAIEPDRHNHELLVRNIRRNGLTNVTARRTALGARPGSALLYPSSDNYGDHRLYGSDGRKPTDTVMVEPLDQVLARCEAPPIDLVKMDVQGYEHHVIQGMGRLLAADRPLTILTEYWPWGIEKAGGNPSEFIGALWAAGFQAHVVHKDELREVASPEDLEEQLPLFDPAFPDACYLNLLWQRS